MLVSSVLSVPPNLNQLPHSVPKVSSAQWDHLLKCSALPELIRIKIDKQIASNAHLASSAQLTHRLTHLIHAPLVITAQLDLV